MKFRYQNDRCRKLSHAFDGFFDAELAGKISIARKESRFDVLEADRGLDAIDRNRDQYFSLEGVLSFSLYPS